MVINGAHTPHGALGMSWRVYFVLRHHQSIFFLIRRETDCIKNSRIHLPVIAVPLLGRRQKCSAMLFQAHAYRNG